jgi:lysophospholipase L1-like esterase
MHFKEQKQFYVAFFIIALAGVLFYFAKPYLPSKVFVENNSPARIVVDSLMIKAMNDMEVVVEPLTAIQDSNQVSKAVTNLISSTKPVSNEPPLTALKDTYYKNLITTSDFDFNLEHLPADSSSIVAIPKTIPLKGYTGIHHLTRFFEKLYELEQDKKTKVRIAYYGDSMIDGDLIVQDFRSALQKRFGGRGVGFVPIKSESARSRYSVKHHTLGNWKQDNFMKGRADSIPYGINGAVFFPEDSTAGVHYLASGIKNAYRLNSPRLFYGPGNEDAVLKVTEEKDSSATYIPLNGTRSFNSASISTSNLRTIQLDFSNAQNTPIYGIDFSNHTGIAVDGFSNRGNSGLPLSLLDISQMQKFDQTLSYDLIILQFGANVLTRKSKNYNWYYSRMTKVVHHLKQAFPEADILILGTADKGTKLDNVVKTDSSVVKLLRSQQQYALKTESSFISLFHLMGGVNTMPIWSDQKLANKDFTHFSPQGSRKISRMIYDELMDGYSAFAKARTQQNLLQQKADSLAIKSVNDSISNLRRP